MRIFNDRYALDGESNPFEMWCRVARWVTSNEEDKQWYGRFLDILSDFRFIPGGRILHAAGQEAKVTAHNCFVLPYPEDSRGGILERLGEWVETMARGGGVGINFSTLRPRGAEVKGVNGTSSGPVPWMEPFSTMSKDVVQQGGTRRGAAMVILNSDHPDIVEFINRKLVPGKMEGANLSVGVLDEPDRLACWPEIINSAWECGDPGLVFLNRCNEMNNLWYDESMEIICTNPCAEIPLPAYGACLLGTINLERFIPTDAKDNFDLPAVDWQGLTKTIEIAVRFLDNVIDLSYYPLPQYQEHQQRVRQMGLGFTGVADSLIKLGYRYGSQIAQDFLWELYRELAEIAYGASIELAKERGSAPVIQKESHARGKYIERLPESIKNDIINYGIRNSFLVGQQPSGTGSLLAGVNSGIEPVFSFNLERKDRTGTWNPETVATKLYKDYPGDAVPDYFVTAHNLSPEEHVDMQAAAQYWCDQAISKTVNAPKDFTKEQVDKLFRYAWEKGLKSISFYRNESRTDQVLYAGDTSCRNGECEV